MVGGNGSATPTHPTAVYAPSLDDRMIVPPYALSSLHFLTTFLSPTFHTSVSAPSLPPSTLSSLPSLLQSMSAAEPPRPVLSSATTAPTPVLLQSRTTTFPRSPATARREPSGENECLVSDCGAEGPGRLPKRFREDRRQRWDGRS